MDLIDCEFCGNPEEIMDMHLVEDMLICGYCIQKVDMLSDSSAAAERKKFCLHALMDK